MDPEDATKSFWQWFREKTTSPLYLTYISTLIVWNWRFFTVLFLEDPNILGVPKIIFIQQNVFNQEYLWWLGLPQSVDLWLSSRLYELAPPAALTWIILYLLPPLANRVHKHSLKYYFDRQLEYHKQSTLYKEQVLGSKTEEARLTQAISKTEKEIQKSQRNLPQEQKWEIEYDNLQTRGIPIKISLANAERIIYGNSGYFSTESGREPNAFITIPDLSLLDSLGLIKLDGNRMSFTDKGKYFLRTFKSKES